MVGDAEKGGLPWAVRPMSARGRDGHGLRGDGDGAMGVTERGMLDPAAGGTAAVPADHHRVR